MNVLTEESKVPEELEARGSTSSSSGFSRINGSVGTVGLGGASKDKTHRHVPDLDLKPSEGKQDLEFTRERP